MFDWSYACKKWNNELNKPEAAVEITSGEFVGFHDSGTDEVEKMRATSIVGAINRAGDDVGGLEIVGGF